LAIWIEEHFCTSINDPLEDQYKLVSRSVVLDQSENDGVPSTLSFPTSLQQHIFSTMGMAVIWYHLNHFEGLP